MVCQDVGFNCITRIGLTPCSTESQARKVPHITVIFENTLKKETIQSLPNGVRQSARIPGSLKNKISPEQAKQWLLFEVKEKQRKKS